MRAAFLILRYGQAHVLNNTASRTVLLVLGEVKQEVGHLSRAHKEKTGFHAKPRSRKEAAKEEG